MKRAFFLTVLIFFFTGNLSFSQEPDFSFSLNSPYHTITSHLYYLQQGRFQPVIAGQTLNVSDPEKGADLAVQLKHILDGKGLYVDLKQLPRDNDYVDTASGKKKYVLFQEYPRIYLEKINGKWLYSSETVLAIPQLHEEVFPFGSDKLIGLIPKIGQKEILGIALWQHLGILILIILSFILYRIFSWLFRIIIGKTTTRVIGGKSEERFIRSIARSLSWILVFILLNIFIPILQLPQLSHYVFLSLKVLVPLFTMFILYRAVDILGTYLTMIAERTKSTLDDQVVPLVVKSLKVFVIVIGVLFILQNLDFDITALLAGLSIGGLAFALAAQDTIKNFFGSLMIFIDRPFQVGDWIMGDKIDGTVEEVGFRSTRVRTFHNSLIYIPNGKLADMTVDNMGLRRYRRMSIQLGITYDTPPDLIEAFIEGIEKIIENHPDTWKDYYMVKFNDMGDFSLKILVYCFFDVPDWKKELTAKQEIFLSIKRLSEEIGVRFAFPTSTMHVEEFPGQESLTPEYDEDKEGFRKKVAAWLSKSGGKRN